MKRIFVSCLFLLINSVEGTITVTSLSNSGTGSLRDAIIQANSTPDTIVFDNSLAGGTITLSGDPLVISNTYTIDGQTNNITVSGGTATRPFFVQSGTPSLSNLTISGGKALGGAGGDTGLGGGGGGGGGLGGGLFADSNVTLTNVTFASNNATGGAGGNVVGTILNGGAGAGGGVGGSGGTAGAGSSGTGGGGGGGALPSETGGNSTVSSGGAGSGSGGNGGNVSEPGSAGGRYGGGGGGGAIVSGIATAGGAGGYGAGGGGEGDSSSTTAGNGGGEGGFGAGGGGVSDNSESNPGTSAFGGGTGAGGSPSDIVGNPGGGGAGLGGAIFVSAQSTTTLAYTNSSAASTAFSGNSVTAGAAGTGQSGSGSAPTAGQALGVDLFIQGGSTLIFDIASGLTLATINAIESNTSGAQSTLQNSGSGTLDLSGQSHQFNANVLMSAGTVKISSDANLGAAGSVLTFSGGSLETSGTFTSDRATSITSTGTVQTDSGTWTLSGAVTGAGSLTKTGTGTFKLSGTLNDYEGSTAINAGTLQSGAENSFSPNSDVDLASSSVLDLNNFNNTIGALSGAGGTVDVGSATLSFGNSRSTTYAGSFTGSGGLLTQGTGTFTLSGDSSGFSGNTQIQNALFVLNQTLGGDVVVNNSATLGGSGTITGNLTVDTGATIAPGNSIGTLAVLGNYVQSANSTYTVEINNTEQSDLIDITGTATLNGGQVEVVPLNGYDINTTYVILNADDGRTGTFAGVSTPPLGNLVAPKLTYTPNQVILEIEAALINAARTPNQKAVARRLDAIVDPDTELSLILNTFINLSFAEARKGLDSLSGEQYTYDPVTTELINRQFIRRLYDPLRNLVTQEPCPSRCGSCEGLDLDLWFEAGGGHTRFKNSYHARGLDWNGYELTGGVQKTFGDAWTFGLAGSYEQDQIHYNLGGSGKLRTLLGGIYGLYRPECYYALADFTYGYSENHLKRRIFIGDLDYVAHGKPKIGQFTFYAETGFDYNFCDFFLVQPFAGIEAAAYSRNRVFENGAGDIDLVINKKDRSFASSRLGVHMTTRQLPWDLDVSVDLAWQYRFCQNDNQQKGHFAGFGDAFTIYGNPLKRNSADGAVTVSKTLCDGWRVYAELVGEVWSRTSTYNALGGIEITW